MEGDGRERQNEKKEDSRRRKEKENNTFFKRSLNVIGNTHIIPEIKRIGHLNAENA